MKIVGVALLTEQGKMYSLLKPARHVDLFKLESMGVLASAKQGFLLDDGSFVDRVEAYIIASCNGQLINENFSASGIKQLYSENLW